MPDMKINELLKAEKDSYDEIMSILDRLPPSFAFGLLSIIWRDYDAKMNAFDLEILEEDVESEELENSGVH